MMKRNMKNNHADSNSAEKRRINSPNEINTLVEIPMYPPNMGLTPKEYQISVQLDSLEKNFKELCEDFLRKSKPDEFNTSYMDAVIERICIDAISHVKVQRCDHVQLIINALDTMHNGDYVAAKNKLQLFLTDKEENARELKKYRRIYWSGTSLAEEV